MRSVTFIGRAALSLAFCAVLRGQEPSPSQPLLQLPSETSEAFASRVRAAPPTRIGLASAAFADYEPETGMLPIALELEEWTAAFGPIGPFALKVEEAQARMVCYNEAEFPVLARFEVQYGRVRCAEVLVATPAGSLPAAVDDSRVAQLLERNPPESVAEYAERVRSLPALRIGSAQVMAAGPGLGGGRLPVQVDVDPWAVDHAPRRPLYLHADAAQARDLIQSGRSLPVKARFEVRGESLTCKAYLAVTPAGLLDLLADPPALSGASLGAQGTWEAQVAVGECAFPMVQVPPGTFMREGNTIQISRSFWIGKAPVTQGQYAAVLGSNPAVFKQAGPEAPVESVSWDDAQAFIARLNAAQAALMFRLPTEAEWEYASRGGSIVGTYGPPDDIAWHRDNSGRSPHPVGRKQPNGFGLQDTLGNVMQWCQDRYGEYPQASERDPQGPATGLCRTFRGGSWNDSPRSINIYFRQSQVPARRLDTVGFRLAATERLP